MSKLKLPPLPSVRELLKLYGIQAKQELSQNFITDLNITDKLVEKVGVEGCDVIEVGPGPGALTRSLLQSNPKSLTVVEKDNRFKETLELLQESKSTRGKLHIVMNDMNRVKEGELLQARQAVPCAWDSDGCRVRLVGNLPFNIATKLLLKWLHLSDTSNGSREAVLWRSFGRIPFVLMFQKEVADRMVAAHNTAEFSRLSVVTQSICHVERLFDITGKVFVPNANVSATVVRLVPRQVNLLTRTAAPGHPAASLPHLERLCAALFTRRRKMLRHSVRELLPQVFPQVTVYEEYERMMVESNIDPTSRPEHVSVPQWCLLANRIHAASKAATAS